MQDVDFGYPTRLYDAIAAGLDELTGIEGRRVVLVFTDGDDTASRIGFGTVIDRAQTEEVMVYAIGLASETVINGRRSRTRPDRSLKKLAEQTGGGYFELSRADQMTTTFTRVAQELHSQYLLGFSPGDPRRQDAQARRAREEAGDDGACAEVLRGFVKRRCEARCSIGRHAEARLARTAPRRRWQRAAARRHPSRPCRRLH